MKTLIVSIQIIFFLLAAHASPAQTHNWAGAPGDYRHMLRISAGLEHGAVIGIGYGYKADIGSIPMILNAQYSMPMGGEFADDFKISTGAQVRWFELGNVQFSTRLNGLFRRYENAHARIANFGCEVGGVLGYYRPHWYLAGEVGFDKA